MTLYVAYLKKLRSLDPDHDTSLMWAAKSLSYIIRYCSKEKISAYTYCVSEGGMPQCMIDYKHGYISPYTLIALPRVVDTINAMPGDIRELTFGLDDIFAYAHKLDNSVKMKQLMRGGLVKMTNALK